jgi:hypothetical protein
MAGLFRPYSSTLSDLVFKGVKIVLLQNIWLKKAYFQLSVLKIKKVLKNLRIFLVLVSHSKYSQMYGEKH